MLKDAKVPLRTYFELLSSDVFNNISMKPSNVQRSVLGGKAGVGNAVVGWLPSYREQVKNTTAAFNAGQEPGHDVRSRLRRLTRQRPNIKSRCLLVLRENELARTLKTTLHRTATATSPCKPHDRLVKAKGVESRRVSHTALWSGCLKALAPSFRVSSPLVSKRTLSVVKAVRRCETADDGNAVAQGRVETAGASKGIEQQSWRRRVALELAKCAAAWRCQDLSAPKWQLGR